MRYNTITGGKDRRRMMTTTLERIRKGLTGHEAEQVYPGEKLPDAAVLIPLVETDEGLSVLFEVRGKDIAQGGEVCFPGGRIEEGETPKETALRETAEELLIPEESIEIIAPLHCLLGHWGGRVTSFAGILHGYTGSCSEQEVSRVFTIPLQFFAENPPQIHRAKMVFQAQEDFPYHLIPGGREYHFASIPRRLCFYETKEGVIWGLTASLLMRFVDLIRPFDCSR